MYIKGNFELALVYYHRGQKLKPDCEIFRLGIQKAQEAIDSAVGGKFYSHTEMHKRVENKFEDIAKVTWQSCIEPLQRRS